MTTKSSPGTSNTSPAPTLASRWNFKELPHSLKQLEQWNPCYITGQKDPKGNIVKTAKRPIGGPKSPFTMKAFKDLQTSLDTTNDQHFGFCILPDDDIVCVDVDHLPSNFTEDDLPDQIRMLIKTFRTYVEVSPSGQGLHIYYRTNKDLLNHRKDQDKGTFGFEGSVFLRNQFVTCTGHKHPLSTDDIETIAVETFDRAVLAPAKIQAISSAPNQRGLSVPNYAIKDVERWLTKIPPNLSESSLQPLLNRAYAQFDPPISNPDDYLHWQYMATATHYAAANLGPAHIAAGEELFVEWSLRGTNDGEDDIRAKYRDCAPKYDGHDLTHLTLIRLASSVKITWPYPVMKTVKEQTVVTDVPETSNILNWEALFDHYELELSQNEINKQYTVTALPQIQDRYFKTRPGTYESKEAIESALLYFAQDSGMSKAKANHATAAAKWWISTATEVFNPVKDWIDNAPPLPASQLEGWFQALWESIELYPHDRYNEELYRSYLKKNLMGVIRTHYYTGQWKQTTGIVILQGGEKSRKSSWLESLLPPELQDYVVNSQAQLDGNAKKLSLEAGICQIWIKNEIEAFMAGSKFQAHKDAALKSFLVDSHDLYRPLFGLVPIKAPRKCIFFGTTNEEELQMSGSGNRRLQIIPVKYCDTSIFDDGFPMVRVYQELLEEFRNTPLDKQPDLWVLTDEEERLTNEINNEERKAESASDTVVKDVFDFTAPYDISPYLTERGVINKKTIWKLKDIKAEVSSRTGDNISPSQLKHVLKRLAGQWTGTVKQFRTEGNWSIEKGLAKCRSKGKVACQGYLMPPIINLFEDLDSQEVK